MCKKSRRKERFTDKNPYVIHPFQISPKSTQHASVLSRFLRKLAAKSDVYFKYPPKHQPVVPAAIAFPSLSFAPACTSTCTQLLVMPSMVACFPSLRIFTLVPADITARTEVVVASPLRSLRFSLTIIVLFGRRWKKRQPHPTVRK